MTLRVFSFFFETFKRQILLHRSWGSSKQAAGPEFNGRVIIALSFHQFNFYDFLQIMVRSPTDFFQFGRYIIFSSFAGARWYVNLIDLYRLMWEMRNVRVMEPLRLTVTFERSELWSGRNVNIYQDRFNWKINWTVKTSICNKTIRSGTRPGCMFYWWRTVWQCWSADIMSCY